MTGSRSSARSPWRGRLIRRALATSILAGSLSTGAVLGLAGCESSNERCARSIGCELSGLCGHEAAEGCVATTRAHCAKSQACVVHGQCTPANNKCEVASDDDCKNAVVCKEDGSCQRIVRWDGVPACVPDCRKRRPCRTAGYCVRKGDRCLPGSDDDCRQSSACKERGRCIIGEDGQCDEPAPD